MKIMYFNPKNCKYQSSQVLKIENGLIYCLNKSANYQYTEKVEDIKRFMLAENPNWHGSEKKPLVKIVGFKII